MINIKQYADSISKMFKWNYTTVIRTHYKLKDHLMDKKVSKMVKTNNVNAVFYTLENDRDKWSNTSTINHAHLLIQGRNLTREDVAKSLNINPKSVIDVEKLKGSRKQQTTSLNQCGVKTHIITYFIKIKNRQ